MYITICDHKKTEEIQEEFMRIFPYLRIEFISKSSHKKGKSQIVGKYKRDKNTEHTVIIPKMTVGELVKQFLEKYGLALRIFRKAGRSWLETSSTLEWTLEKQNAEGKALSN